MENVNEFIATEMKKRTDLVYSDSFRAKCAYIAKNVMGISEEDWKANMIAICMYLANKVCSMENNLTNN
jgi:hypothetical protein